MKIEKIWILFIFMIFASSCTYVTIEIVDEYKNGLITCMEKYVHVKNCDVVFFLYPLKGDTLSVYSFWDIKSKKGTKPIIKKIQYGFYRDEKCLMKIDVDSVLIKNHLEFKDTSSNYRKFIQKKGNYVFESIIHYHLKSDVSDSFYFKGSATIFNNEENIEYSFLEKIKLYRN